MKAVIYNDINDYKVKDDIREPEINDILNVKIKVINTVEFMEATHT